MGNGPLSGIKIIEMTGIGPGPYCAMLLSDMGAEVLRIDRKGGGGGIPGDPHSRGRRSLALDLKSLKRWRPYCVWSSKPMRCKRVIAPA